jgi:prepilin-type N-terminal cleavage/methylation domain-containing protein/prepilin-type processing-associated H-X9-DG protein
MCLAARVARQGLWFCRNLHVFSKKDMGGPPLPRIKTEIPMSFKTPHRRRAFTLVELLVAIGIIAILVGILIPTIRIVVETSRSVKCLNNLRQMAIASNAYAATYGTYPVAYAYAASGPGNISFAWDFTTTFQPGQPLQVQPGLIWMDGGVERIQQCPSFEGAANWLSDPYTGYNYNTSYIGHGQFESIPTPMSPRQVKNATQTALFGDGQYSAGADKFMRSPWPNAGDANFSPRWSGTQGFRHRGSTNVVFCDGHAESRSDIHTSNQDGPTGVAPGTGFLSDDNSLYGGEVSHTPGP